MVSPPLSPPFELMPGEEAGRVVCTHSARGGVGRAPIIMSESIIGVAGGLPGTRGSRRRARPWDFSLLFVALSLRFTSTKKGNLLRVNVTQNIAGI